MNRYELENALCLYLHTDKDMPDVMALIDDYVSSLKTALDKIAYPIKYLQQDAEKEGAELNGLFANQLSNDPNYLKDIARKAVQQNT